MANNRFTAPSAKEQRSEEELLADLKNHDEKAIQYVYQSCWPMVLQLVKVNSGTEEDAKDLYQESIMDFLEKVWQEGFVLTCKIRNFLYSICRYKWLYSLREGKSFLDIEEYIEIEPAPEETTDAWDGLPDEAQITAAIDALGDPCRSLLIGYYYEELSLDQLAARLQYKTANVAKQQKFRCMDRLKQALLKL